MSTQAEYMVGWRDTTIHDFLMEIREPTSSMRYTLITCIDSSFNLGSFRERSRQLSKLNGKWKLVGQGLLVNTRQLLVAESQDRLFFGFDEVWFFPRANIAPKPENLVIIGPDTIKPREIEEHSEWMRSNNCSLGLGDGTGMNYCLRVRGVPKYVVTALNEPVSIHK